MGLASWRARWTLSEYAAAATGGGALSSRSGRPHFNRSLNPLGLNEVGVTDAVLATLWQFGPGGAAYGVSARAESHYFGADIALVDVMSKRILLYQAKLARLDGSDLKLKSHVPVSHVKHLTRAAVRIGGDRYTIAGRLALYQVGHIPFLSHCAGLDFWRLPFGWPESFAWRSWGRVVGQPAQTLAVSTTKTCSSTETARQVACSLLQSPAEAVRSTPFRRLRRGPGNSTSSTGISRCGVPSIRLPGGSSGGDGPGPDAVFPEFTRYTPAQDDGVQVGDAGELADGLRQALRLPAGHTLFVIAP